MLRLHLALAAMAAAAIAATLLTLGLTADASGATSHWEALTSDLSLRSIAPIALGSFCLAAVFAGLRALAGQLRRTSRAVAALDRRGTREGAIVFHDSRPLAFCSGLRHPQVFVSTGAIGALEPQALSAVLEHERHHAFRRDPLRLLLVHALSEALFIAPALRGLASRYGTLLELSADATAVRASGGNAAPLARALLTFDARPDAGGVDPARVDHLLGAPGDRQLPLAALLSSGLAVGGLLLATAGAVEFGGVLELCLPVAQHACFVVLDIGPLLLGAALVLRVRDGIGRFRSS